MVDAQCGILIVSRDLLLDLPLVAIVRSRTIVSKWLWAGEFVVAGGCCDDVAMAGYLAGKASNGASD